jgi:hypothetical protein
MFIIHVTFVVGYVVTERRVSLLFSGELDNGDCYVLLPIEE